MHVGPLMLVAALAAGQVNDPPAPTPSPPGQARIERCLVTLVKDVRVSSEEAGVLDLVEVREGLEVKKGGLLAQIRDKQVQIQRRVAIAERDVAIEKSRNDINVRYAKAARDVALKEYELNSQANKTVPGSKSIVEMEKLWLTATQATLQIEQSTHELEIARLECEARVAKVEAADDDIRRRKILAPIDGVVVEVVSREGEYVEPSKPVFRIMDLEHLRVEGFLNVKDFSPGDVAGRSVEVTVTLARGVQEKFKGSVVFVHPQVQAGGEFQVRAEVTNTRDPASGQWRLRPGLIADMMIDTGSLAPVAGN